jgi:hypothetical protein
MKTRARRKNRSKKQFYEKKEKKDGGEHYRSSVFTPPGISNPRAGIFFI